MQLRPVVARRPAGASLALKPLKPIAHAPKATVPNRGSSYGLRHLFLPRIDHSSPLPTAPCGDRGMGRRSCPAPRAKPPRDEAEQGEKKAAAPERRPAAQRSLAYRVFADIYACAYVCCWRTGELIVLNAQEGLDRLSRYVRDNLFNRKR